jgi:hypothetical protein
MHLAEILASTEADVHDEIEAGPETKHVAGEVRA